MNRIKSSSKATNGTGHNKRLYYGWINLAVLWVCYLSTIGTITYNFGVAVVPMTAELKMSMTVATACYSGSTLLQALMAPLMGHYIEKRGVRSTMMLGTAFLVIGCIILGCARGILTYFIGWLPFVAIGQRFGAMAPSQISIANWFYRKRGLATALFFTSGGVAGFIFMPLMTEIAERFSWRHTWFTIVGFSLISFLLVTLFLKNKPEDVGQIIDGSNEIPDEIQKTTANYAAYKTTEVWTIREVSRTVQFYQVCFLQISVAFLQIAISSQALNYMVLSGIGGSVAASAIGIFSITSTAGRLLAGIFSDRTESKKIMIVGSIFAFCGVMCLMKVDNAIMAYAFALTAGIGFGMFMVGPPTMLADFFGTADYVKVNSRYSLISGFVSAFAAVIVGALYDYTGGYTAVWSAVLVVILVNGISMLLLRQPKKKQAAS